MRSLHRFSIALAASLLICLISSPAALLRSHGAASHEAAREQKSPLPVETEQFGALSVSFVKISGESHHGSHTQGLDLSLEALLKSPILISGALNSSMNRVSGTAASPPATNAPRPAQIIDVSVGPGDTFVYVPQTVNIHVGDTVRWTFASLGHNVISGSSCTANNQFCSPNDTNCAFSQSSGLGETYSHTFNQAGTFQYFCSPHCFNGMTGTVVVTPAVVQQQAVNSDFDGDRKTDTAVFRPSNGVWYILQSSNNGFRAESFGTSGDLLAPADYDGDGKIDVAVFRPSNGTFFIIQSLTGTVRVVQFGSNGDLPTPGDFDGDFKADIAVWRPSNGTWYRLNSSNGAFNAQGWGLAEDKPVLGDFDADNKTDLAVFRPSNGTWYVLRSTAGFTAVQFGLSTDLPTAADYDGDGKADVAVFRPDNGTWYMLRSTAGFTAVQFGTSGDRPALGDYEGDNKADVAVWRPSNGTFYVTQSSNGAFRATQWGLNGDLPAPSAYVP